jgi:hypothetical protein
MEEELLVVISGEVEICLPDCESDCDPPTERLRPGDFAYYPAYRWHTLRNVAQSPACYVMFKWRGTMAHAGAPLQTQVVHPEVEREPKKDFDVDVLFQGATCFLDRLQAHLTKLRHGCGYRLHRDEYDVVIVVLEGRISLLGGELARGASHIAWRARNTACKTAVKGQLDILFSSSRNPIWSTYRRRSRPRCLFL